MNHKSRREQIAQEALDCALGGVVLSNYPAIIEGFTRKGIPESEILPRENVFTYHAWRALGRQVRRGEHGVKVVTVITTERKTGEIDAVTGAEKIEYDRRPWTATVFHVSQTDPVERKVA
jgi:hypothetical protein